MIQQYIALFRAVVFQYLSCSDHIKIVTYIAPFWTRASVNIFDLGGSI